MVSEHRAIGGSAGQLTVEALRPRRGGRASGATWLAVGLAVIVGCADSSHAEGDRDTIAILAGNALAGSDRVVRLLDEIAAVTEVLGPARFEIVDTRGAKPEELAGRLGDRRDLRAVIALVGDLSVLENVDPSLGASRPRALSSRRLDRRVIERALDDLQARADELGAQLVLATHPLGRQGRIEVPELGVVADVVRERHRVLDLAAAFATLESAALFENRIDRLNAYGHDELARAILRWLVGDGPSLPTRSEDEALARLQTRALWAWLDGPQDVFEELARRALSGDPRSLGATVRAAALATAMDPGDDDGRCAGWHAIEVTEDDAAGEWAGLALGLRLCGRDATNIETSDPVERELLRLLDALEQRDESSWELGLRLCDAFPHRLEAWVALDLVARWTRTPHAVWSEARATLGALSRGLVLPGRALVLRGSWPSSVATLPSLLVASRPFASFLPDGPALAMARRRAALGFGGAAAQIIDRALKRGRRPAHWEAERDRLLDARR